MAGYHVCLNRLAKLAKERNRTFLRFSDCPPLLFQSRSCRLFGQVNQWEMFYEKLTLHFSQGAIHILWSSKFGHFWPPPPSWGCFLLNLAGSNLLTPLPPSIKLRSIWTALKFPIFPREMGICTEIFPSTEPREKESATLGSNMFSDHCFYP